MDLITYYEIILERWKIVLAAFLATTVTTILLSFMQTPTYEAANTFVLRPRATALRGDSDFVRVLDTLSNRVEINATIVEVAKSDLVKTQAAERLNLESSEKRTYQVDSRVIPGTNAVEISVRGPSPDEVKDFVNAVSIETGNYMIDLYNVFQLDLLDEAGVPSSPISPNKFLNILLGMVFGFVLGVGLAFVADYFNFPHERIKPFDVIDHETGAYNEEYLMLRLDQELSRAEKQENPFSLSLIEIKTSGSNVILSYRSRTKLLREAVTIMKEHLPKENIIASYKNSSLAVLIPNTKQEDAEKYTEELLAEYLSNSEKDENIEVQVAAGVATYEHDDLAKEDLLAHAKHALDRKAKESE